MSAPTLTGPSRRTQEISDRLVVRYRRDDGSWQADISMPLCWDEVRAYRRANARAQWLRDNDDRRDVEIIRMTPRVS